MAVIEVSSKNFADSIFDAMWKWALNLVYISQTTEENIFSANLLIRFYLRELHLVWISLYFISVLIPTSSFSFPHQIQKKLLSMFKWRVFEWSWFCWEWKNVFLKNISLQNKTWLVLQNFRLIHRLVLTFKHCFMNVSFIYYCKKLVNFNTNNSFVCFLGQGTLKKKLSRK